MFEGPKAPSVTIYLFACFSKADGLKGDIKGDINKLFDIRR